MTDYNQLFNQSSEMMFTEENGPINRIYVDMEYLQDLRFGALLQMLRVPKEMEYIYHELDDYNKKYDYECASHFPALGYTDEQLDVVLSDSNKIDMVCFKAPFTSAYYQFTNILMMLQHHNRAVSSKPLDIYVQVNVANPLYPTELLREFKDNLAKLLPGTNVEFSRQPRYTCPIDDYNNKQLLMLYNIEEFLKQDTPTSLAMVGEGTFFNKKVFSIPYVNKNLKHEPEEYNDVLSMTQTQLNVYCDFAYLPSYIERQ